MKKLINWFKSLLKKEEPKIEINPKIEHIKNLIERIEKKDKDSENEVTNNDIAVWDKTQQKTIFISGEKKKKIIKKVQTELSKNPELFISNETGEEQNKINIVDNIKKNKKIIELPTGEQKIVPKKKRYYKSTPKKNK